MGYGIQTNVLEILLYDKPEEFEVLLMTTILGAFHGSSFSKYRYESKEQLMQSVLDYVLEGKDPAEIDFYILLRMIVVLNAVLTSQGVNNDF